MTFKTADQINSHLIQLAQKERHMSHEILVHIDLFCKISGFLKFGYATIYDYLVGELKYSEDQAYRRIKAAKLLKLIPEVADKIKEGSLSMTQVMRVQNAITQSENLKKKNQFNDSALASSSSHPIKERNCNFTSCSTSHTTDKKALLQDEIQLRSKVSEIIQKIENKNSFETQKILAEDFNLPSTVKDKVKPLSNDTVKLEIHLSEEQYNKLKEVKSKLSHQFPDQRISEIIEHLCDQVLKQPAEKNKKEVQLKENKANRSARKTAQEDIKHFDAALKNDATVVEVSNPLEINNAVKVDASVEAPNKVKRSRHVPASIRRYVLKRAQMRCEFTSKDGKRCNSEYQLEIEHVLPFSLGGVHSIENCKCYCHFHNSYSATQMNIGFEHF